MNHTNSCPKSLKITKYTLDLEYYSASLQFTCLNELRMRNPNHENEEFSQRQPMVEPKMKNEESPR